MPFEKGNIANPNGRPKQSKRIEGGIIAALSEQYKGLENGARAIGYELVRIASDREHTDQMKAIKEIADRLDGKPSQSVDMKATILTPEDALKELLGKLNGDE